MKHRSVVLAMSAITAVLGALVVVIGRRHKILRPLQRRPRSGPKGLSQMTSARNPAHLGVRQPEGQGYSPYAGRM
jgi:hypothetical protein